MVLFEVFGRDRGYTRGKGGMGSLGRSMIEVHDVKFLCNYFFLKKEKISVIKVRIEKN